jgi:signal transduction histidine kinase
LRRLFWLALLVAALPSSLVALVVGRWAGKAAARPIEELARRLGPVHHARDYTLAPPGRLPAEAAVLERAFSTVLGRLEGALDREADFARNAAHELRTPLTRIRLRAERAASVASGENRRELEAIIEEIDRLARLADALLVLARDETSGLGAGETVNLADTVRVSAGEGDRPVDVTSPDEALVRGDEDLLRLAVDNLLDNARKYAPAGLTPLVRLGVDGAGVTVGVETPGVTLDADERARVFERFYRGAAARETAPGHGLGLALARHVARFHGGDLVVAEGGDGRTVFELRLPAWRSGA